MNKRFYALIPSLILENDNERNRKLNKERENARRILLTQLLDRNIQPLVCSQNYKEEDYLFKNDVIYVDAPKISVNHARNVLHQEFGKLEDKHDLVLCIDDDHFFDEIFYQRVNLLDYFEYLHSNMDKFDILHLTRNGGSPFTTGLEKKHPWKSNRDELIHKENRNGMFALCAYFINYSKYSNFNYDFVGLVFEQEYMVLESIRQKYRIYSTNKPITDQPYKIPSVLRRSYKENGTPFDEQFINNPIILDYLINTIKVNEFVPEFDENNFKYHPPLWIKIVKNYINQIQPEPIGIDFRYNLGLYTDEMKKNISEYNKKFDKLK